MPLKSAAMPSSASFALALCLSALAPLSARAQGITVDLVGEVTQVDPLKWSGVSVSSAITISYTYDAAVQPVFTSSSNSGDGQAGIYLISNAAQPLLTAQFGGHVVQAKALGINVYDGYNTPYWGDGIEVTGWQDFTLDGQKVEQANLGLKFYGAANEDLWSGVQLPIAYDLSRFSIVRDGHVSLGLGDDESLHFRVTAITPSVPEPTTGALFGLGCFAIAFLLRKKPMVCRAFASGVIP